MVSGSIVPVGTKMSYFTDIFKSDGQELRRGPNARVYKINHQIHRGVSPFTWTIGVAKTGRIERKGVREAEEDEDEEEEDKEEEDKE